MKKGWIILLLAAALIAVSVRLAVSGNEKMDSKDSSEKGNAAIENIMTRCSVRQYSGKPISDEDLETILKAGMAAPTAVNQQPWEFVVITDADLRKRISEEFKFAKMVSECAVAIAVCGNMDKLFEGDRVDGGNWTLDCSAASENMLLAAHALGIGSVWCGVYPEQERMAALGEILSLPTNIKPLNVIAFGYPASETTPKVKWNPEAVHYNMF